MTHMNEYLPERLAANPLQAMESDSDIEAIADAVISASVLRDECDGDAAFKNSARQLLYACLGYLRDWCSYEQRTVGNLKALLDAAHPSAPGSAATDLSRSFGTGNATGDSDWSWEPTNLKRNSDGMRPADCGGLSPDEDFALMNYKNFKVAAGKTLKSIIISCNVRLAPIATAGVRSLLEYDEMELDTLGDPDAKVAVFGILSDTDKTLSFLFAIMMWQCIDQLCRKALTDYGGKLPTPVHFIFDEFANIGTIPQIEETIAVTRSRNIGITIILQSMSQLESKYDKKAQTIVDCCDSTLFLGGKSNSTNKEIAEMIGKQTINQMTYGESTGQSGSASKNLQIQGRDLIDAAEIGKMSRRKAILLIAGTNPLMDDKFDPHTHKRYCYIVDKRNPKRLHDKPFDFKRYLAGGCEPYDDHDDGESSE